MMGTRSLAIAILTALALGLALAAGPAQGKLVYDYVYSGDYIDGSGSEKGPFPSGLAGVAYDEKSEQLLAAVGGNPGYLSKFTKAGAADPFGAPGLTDTIVFPEGLEADTQVAVDNSGGPHDGNVYLESISFGGATSYGFAPDGTPIPGFKQFSAGACGIAVDPQGDIWLASRSGLDGHGEIEELTPAGVRTGKVIELDYRACRPAIDTEGNFYLTKAGEFSKAGKPAKLDPTGKELYEVSQASASAFALDPSDNDVFVLEGNLVSQYDSLGAKLGSFGPPDPGHSFAGLSGVGGIAVDPETHDVWVTNGRDYGGGVRHLERFERSAPITVPTATTGAVDHALSSATLNGLLDPDGVETTDCHFDWGTTQALGKTVPCAQGPFTGSGDNPVSAQINGLKKGTAYYFRLSAKNGNERVSTGATKKFIAQAKPILESVFASGVNTDGAHLNAEIDPNGGNTTYHFIWGTDESYGSSSPESAPFGLLESKSASNVITGLTPGTTYHYRVLATNEAGTTTSEDLQLTTYVPDPGTDPCPNSAVRQQTGSALLLDCRAYELASAADTGGYDVESDLLPGQTPLISSPRASDHLLYSVHSGLIPGISGNPTNFDRDPYLADRGANGWSTQYVGLPANGMAEQGAFGSPLLESDSRLDRFAFGGEGICSPCFADGSTNIPLRQPDGSIVRGMAGSLQVAANPSGSIARRFSADGSHLVFGTASQLETADKDGLLTIYDRDLIAGVTQVVSTLPSGVTIAGGEVAELGISADGSRVVVGQRVSTDAEGNDYYHPYMHIGANPKSIDLAPAATTTGVLFDGMTAGGSKVFLTTKDRLIPAQDTDQSADIYLAEVDSAGKRTLSLVSVGQGGPSNDDSCEPPGVPDSWNAASGDGKCGALAFAGGAGLASANGTFYFLSPELLDGPSKGEANQANLYVVRPGSKPRFVASMDSSLGKPGPKVGLGLLKTFGSFPKKVFIATDNSGGPSDGDVYVADPGAGVVKKFDSSGNPITSWGVGGVLDGSKPEVETIRINAFSGNWKVALDGQSTGELPYNIDAQELQERLEELPNVDPGDVVVTGGPPVKSTLLYLAITFGGQYSAANLPSVDVTDVDLKGNSQPLISASKGPFGDEMKGIAIDPTGHLNVMSYLKRGAGLENELQISRFADDGSYVDTHTRGNVSPGDLGIAMDSLGEDFFAIDDFSGSESLLRFEVEDGNKNVVRVVMNPESLFSAIASDAATGDLYVATVDGKIELVSFNGSKEVIEPGGKTCAPGGFGGSAGCHPTGIFAAGLAGLAGLAVDPTTHHVFADLGKEVVELDTNGEQVGNAFGSGLLSGSNAVAFGRSGGRVYASNASAGKVAIFVPAPTSWAPIDNPAIVHAVNDAATHHYGDFQVSPDGRFAAFASSGPLSKGFANQGHSEIYRYVPDANEGAGELGCASCAPTGAGATSDTFLAPYGLSLSDDGRLFFTSAEPFVLRDTNQKRDAYEWSSGAIQLISTGASPEDSSLLSVSADGADAYFFTRQTLSSEDENGSAVKIYDAREEGGFPHDPPPFPCAASDECHGAGTQAPSPPNISTVTGSGPGAVADGKKCKKGFIKRGGKCVKRPHRRQRGKHRSTSRRGGLR